MDDNARMDAVREIACDAGVLALSYFEQLEDITVDRKGHQDFVSEADRQVELKIRQDLARAFPDDAIIGEEHAPTPGTSGFTWVIDPIDGTMNFIHAIPAWTVVIAGVRDGQTQIGVIHDPCHGDTFSAIRGQGAFLNGEPVSVARGGSFDDGTVGIGYSNRVAQENVVRLVQGLVGAGALFYRNASGALSLAYVAAGRLLGYREEHMNAWDCLAGQLLVAEAGGLIEDQDARAMIADGGRVIAAAPGVFADLVDICDRAFGGA